MKRYGTDFESKSDQKQHTAGNEVNRPLLLCLEQEGRDLSEVRRANRPIDERDAVKQNPVAKAPIRKYFIAASLDRLLVRQMPVST